MRTLVIVSRIENTIIVCSSIRLQSQVLLQWWWWRLDHIAGTNNTCLPGNYKLIGNDSTIIKCQPCHPCGTGMKLTPPCGRTVTLDTIVICVPISIHATKRIPRKTHLPTEGIKLTYLSNGKGTNHLSIRNEKVFTWSPLEVNDIYKTERLDNSNSSKLDEHFFSHKRSTPDIPRTTTVPSRAHSLPYTVKRWEKKYDNQSLLLSRPRRPLIQQSKRPKHFTTPYTERLHGKTSNATWGSQIINITYVLGGFPWVEAVVVVVLVIISVLLGFVVWLLNSIRHIIWNKDCRDYQRLKSAESIEGGRKIIVYCNYFLGT